MKKRQRLNLILTISSVILSGIAVAVSIAAIYFSGFYKSHELNVSIVGSTKSNFTDNFDVDIVFQNQGNTYSTILSADIVFSWGDKSNYYHFDSLGDPLYDVIYKPLILTPGEQVTKTLTVKHKFENRNYIRNLGAKKLVYQGRSYYSVDLLIFFINNEGRLGSQNIPFGKLFFKEDSTIDELSITFNSQSVDLNRKSITGVAVSRRIPYQDSITFDKILWDSVFNASKQDTLTTHKIYIELLFEKTYAKQAKKP